MVQYKALSFLILCLAFLLIFYKHTGRDVKPKIEPIVIVHGGAGTMLPSSMDPKVNGVKLAARMGYAALQKTGSVLDAVQEAIRSMEVDPIFNCGYGSAIASNGEVEMCAGIMNGSDLSSGSVSLLKNIMSPISVARLVMEKTRHTYLAGEGAMEFARNNGVEFLPDGALVIDQAKIDLENYHEHVKQGIDFAWYDVSFGEPGTVGAVAIDADGNIAAATTSGGFTGKHPGRIGDSAIIGAGTLADNEFGGVSCTGSGETIVKLGIARKLLALVRYEGLSVQKAAESVTIEMIQRFNVTGGVIALDPKGEIGIHFTASHMGWSYMRGSKLHYGLARGEHHVEDIE